MKAVDIKILQTLFAKHNKMTSKYSWEPREVIAYEHLMKELKGVETVYVDTSTPTQEGEEHLRETNESND